MVYLLASLRMFVYCTVYGDGIHFRRPPAHPPTTMVTSFPLCICYLPSVTVNFSSLALLTAPPLSLLPPPPPVFPRESHPQLDLTSMWFFATKVHVAVTEDIHTKAPRTQHTHTHTRIYKHKPDIFSNTWITCSCVNAKKKKKYGN